MMITKLKIFRTDFVMDQWLHPHKIMKNDYLFMPQSHMNSDSKSIMNESCDIQGSDSEIRL